MKIRVKGVKVKISLISIMHYVKLIYRSILFLLVACAYIASRFKGSDIFSRLERSTPLLMFGWAVFVVEMILRLFPSKLESMGCQKQFKRNYIPNETGDRDKIRRQGYKSTVPVIISWVILNGAIGVLYAQNIIDKGILILISLFYSVCDMICILFFCPFQTWMMKNKCCGSCRIYNWDYAMMFTPFIFIKNIYALTLLGLSLLLLLKWEIEFYLYPERFSETTNKSLSCANCREKLCQHKKQLQSFLKKTGGFITK